MARLEVRFNLPDRRGGGYIVVGHVTWPDPPSTGRPKVEPSPALAMVPAPATILATLRQLVRRAASSLEHLESIRNDYWCLVRIETAPAVLKAEERLGG